MNITGKILTRLNKEGMVKVSDIVKETGYSQPYIHKFFTLLIEQGRLMKTGRGRNTYYIAPGRASQKNTLKFSARLKNKNLSESEVIERIEKETGIFYRVRKNVRTIIRYGFTKMLNNAIEHSASPAINISIARQEGIIRFEVKDYGIGIFNNIRKKYRLNDTYEAVNELLKGKRTTIPESHTGEGIFFTSKAADTFVIQGSGKKVLFNNLIDDVFLSESAYRKGTRINFTIAETSRRTLKKIFDMYTDSDFRFSKTRIFVKLYKIGTEFISRSEAKRILTGLESFETIILDFKNVKFAGQGFADEIFRVYQNLHKNKKITYKNANNDVEFMIKRALKR